MQISDIASIIIEAENVPVHFNNVKTFSSVTYLKPNTDTQRGLYLPDCDSLEALEHWSIVSQVCLMVLGE